MSRKLRRHTVLGNRLWFIDIGVIFNNTDEGGLEIDPAPAFSTGFNFPLADHLDIGFGISYTHQSGKVCYYERYYSYFYYNYRTYPVYRTVRVEEDFKLTTFSGNADLTLCLAPGNPVNPFIIGGGFYVSQDSEVDGYTDSFNDGGFLAGGGIEFMIGKKASLIPSVIYSEIDDAHETAINGLFAYWYAFRHAFRLSASYGTESENIAVSAGWMYSF